MHTADRRRRRWLLLVAVVLAGAAVTVLAAAELSGGGRPREAARSPAIAAPPAGEITTLRTALHDIGTRCRHRPTNGDPQLAADATTIVAFTHRYPQASFVLDDEHATPLAVLLVARQALRGCDPSAAATVGAALPPGYRNGTG